MGSTRTGTSAISRTAVVSISLGDDCLFRVGGRTRGGQTVSFRLESGDVVVLGAKDGSLPRRRPHLSEHVDAS